MGIEAWVGVPKGFELEDSNQAELDDEGKGKQGCRRKDEETSVSNEDRVKEALGKPGGPVLLSTSGTLPCQSPRVLSEIKGTSKGEQVEDNWVGVALGLIL